MELTNQFFPEILWSTLLLVVFRRHRNDLQSLTIVVIIKS